MTAVAPIIIVTSGRSGSRAIVDLLQRSGLPALTSPISDNRGAIFEDGELNEMQSFVDSFRYDPGFRYDDLEPHAAPIAALEAWLTQRLAPYAGSRPVMKDPRILYLIPVYRRLFPDAQFVHVVRDGRDFVVSKQEELAFHGRTPASPEALLTLWNARMAMVEPFRGEAWFHELRFEDFLEAPLSVAARLWQFLGLGGQPILPPIDTSRARRYLHASEPPLLTVPYLRLLGYA